MKKLFLNEITDLGDLYYSDILYQYEGVPICFLCENKKGDIILGHCSELRTFRRWILVKMNLNKLTQLAKGEISLFSALTVNKTVVEVDYDYDSKEYHSSEKKIADVDPLNFPEPDIFLEDFEQDILRSFLESKSYITENAVQTKISTGTFQHLFEKKEKSPYKTVLAKQGHLVGNNLNHEVVVA